MDFREAETRFRERVGDGGDELTPRRAVEAMFAFYEEQRAVGVDPDPGGDMLLYQWYDHALDITRQFFAEDEDEPYQLHVTLHFDPSEADWALDTRSEWCKTPQDLPAFRQMVMSSALFQALADTQPTKVEIHFEAC